MADRLTVLSDLKSAFANFDDMSNLIDTMRGLASDIDTYNKAVAGSDDIGKQYHKSVDDSTKNLSDLLKTVRDRVDQVGTGGQETTDGFTNAAQQGADLAHGL